MRPRGPRPAPGAEGEGSMSILEESARLALRRLGPGARGMTVERLVVGLFFTGVKLSCGSAGIAFTPVKEIPQAVCCPSSAAATFDPVRTRGAPAADLLGALTSDEPLRTAVAVATLNALTAACWEGGLTGRCRIQTGRDAQDAVRMPEGARVAVVGAFVPVLRTLKRRGGEWWVVERDPRTLRPDELSHFVPPERGPEVFGRADVLVITGVSLLYHTLDAILDAARPGAEIAVMGPTASMLPEPLFDRGVRVVGGVWVRRPDETLDVLAAGGSGYHLFGRLVDRVVIERPD